LKNRSVGPLVLLTSWKPWPFRRAMSGPVIVAELSWPDSSRFACVVRFWMILKVTFAGVPGAAVVAPLGPHV
jgi:hypothetical protein